MRPMFRFDVYTERLEGLKYEGSTTAVSEAKAINNVRYNTRGNYETQYNGWPWSAVNKGPATEEDRQMDMINQAEELKREKAKTFVPVDFDRLEKAAKARRLKMKDINAWLERNASYCSQRRKYGTLSAWDVTTIIEHGIPYEEFQPGVQKYETSDIMNGDEKIAEIQTPVADVKEEPAEVVNFAGPLNTEMVFLAIDEEDMELLRVLSKAKSQHVADVCLGIIREQLDGIRLMIAEL